MHSDNQNSLRSLYIMIPLAHLHPNCHMEEQIEQLLKLDRDQFNVYQVVDEEYVVRIDDFKLSFLQIDAIIKQFEENQQKIAMLEHVLENLESPTANKQSYSYPESGHIDELVKKAKKAKDLKEQNKKLKKLLQIQLENTEKVREETQKTMKNLKEQFDALVHEMTMKQNKEREQKETKELGKDYHKHPRKIGLS